MKNVEVPISDSYDEYLISSLKDPEEAAAYFEAILEEQNPEPELLQKALRNLTAALGKEVMSSEQAKLYYQQLDELLSQGGSDAIYSLGVWLNALGLKLTVTACEQARTFHQGLPPTHHDRDTL